MAVGTGLFIRALPYNDILINTKGKDAGKPTDEMAKWAESVQRQTGASPVAPDPAAQLGVAPDPPIQQSRSGTLGGDIPAGLYAVYVYREVIVADPVSSSLNGSINWTHNGKAMTRALSAFAGAPQTINDSAGDVLVIEIDPNTPISYTLTYASNTPGLAEFQASLLANLLQTLS